MIELTKETFEAEVLSARETVFVDYYSDGCVPCQALFGFVHEMAERYGTRMKFCALNITHARRTAIGQRILGVPVMAVYRGGVKAAELVKDDATPDAIEQMIKEYLD